MLFMCKKTSEIWSVLQNNVFLRTHNDLNHICLTLISLFMKTKLLLLLSVCIGMTSSAWALEKEGDIYQIGTAQDLADFAALVNGGELEVNAVLTDDIDMSGLMEDEWVAIGDWGGISGTSSAGYKGHFNGQGHTIKNFNFNATHNYFALFGVIWGSALVENFTIEGTISVDGGYQYVAGVAAYTNNTPTIRNVHSKVNINSTSTVSTPRLGGVVGGCPAQNSKTVIDRCTYSGTLNANDKGGNYGGIVGYILSNANATVDITNCLFDGKIQGEITTNSAQLGGIIGYTRKGIVSVNNCLSIGTIEYEDGNAMNVGQFVGRITYDSNTTGLTFAKNYYKDTGISVNGTSGGAGKGTAPVAVTAEQLASGEIAYALNGEQSDEVSWFQKLGTDEYPTPYGTDIVYPAGHQHCDGTAYEGVTGFSNVAGVQDDHDFVDGYCSYCGAIDADYLTANVDGFFEIGTPNQLKWFADYVNQIDPAADAMLTADIDLDGIAWTPIGNAEVAYTGTFDGNNKKITGFSYTSKGNGGLFGKTRAAIIKNFSIDGELNIEEGKYAGVIAQAMKSTITNIHSSLTITVVNGSHMGGVVGSTEGDSGTTISNCSFSGSITFTANINGSVAGVVGYMSADRVINCANYGDVSFIATNCNAGGIVAYINSTAAYVEHCLNTGKLTCSGGTPIYGSAIVGRIKNNFTPSQLSDNYWLEGSALAAAKKDNTEGDVLPDTKKVTAEQLASGEVAYNLGEAWGQAIGTEATPVIDGAPVSYVGEAGYATMYDTTTGYELNGDVKAYAGIIKDNAYISLTEVDNIPASTAVVLKGTYYNKIAADLQPINIVNELKGTAVDTEATGSQYVLAKPENEEVGFYQATTGTIKAGKAYLELPSTEVKAFYFGGENETAIVSPLGETKEGVAIYNLAGQRISKLQKGVNIVSGRKVLF